MCARMSFRTVRGEQNKQMKKKEKKMGYNAKSYCNFERMTEQQLRNQIRAFAGTEFEMEARAELQRRGLPQEPQDK